MKRLALLFLITSCATEASPPSCSDAMAHFYSTGCMYFDANTVMPIDQAGAVQLCESTISSTPTARTDLADAWLECNASVHGPVSSSEECPCPTELEALRMCKEPRSRFPWTHNSTNRIIRLGRQAVSGVSDIGGDLHRDVAKATHRRGEPRVAQPRGSSYPITTEWRVAVLKHLADNGISEKQFALAVGCAQSTMHDILHDPLTVGTSRMPRIHSELCWPPPAKPLPPPTETFVLSDEASELARLSDLAPDDVKQQLLEQARMWLKKLGIKH